jgi:cytochrome P450
MTTLADRAPAVAETAATLYFDPLSYAAYDHPYELYRRLRAEAPVYYNERRDLYVVSRYADVQACLRNHEQLINAFGNDIDGSHDSYGQGMLVCQDPPRHTVLRDAIRRSFGAREILAMQAGIRELSARLIAAMREKGSGDFTEDVALPLVFDVALRLAGAPSGDAPYFIEHLWRAMARTVGKFGIPEDAAAANEESEDHLAEIVNRRRAELDAGVNSAAPDAITQILLQSGELVQHRDAGAPGTAPGEDQELRGRGAALREPGAESLAADHDRDQRRGGHHPGELPGHAAHGVGEP